MESITLYEKRDELRRVLQSRNFTKARKKSRFLEFVCEQSFLGNADKLNEYLIGMEVYERGPDFDPQKDPIVRVQAHEIRRSLKEYYESEGKGNPWRIDLPAGHYVPIFSKVPGEESQPRVGKPALPVRAPGPSREKILIGLLSLLSAVLALLLIRERVQRRLEPPPAMASFALTPAMEWFWKPFLPPAAPALVVLPNHPLLRAAHEGDTPETLARSHLIPKERLPEFRDTMHYRELKGFFFVPSTTDFTSIGESLGVVNLLELFTGMGSKPVVKPSRLVNFEDIKKGNSILLGGNQPWSGRIFIYPEGFWFHTGVIWNKTPRPGEQPAYKPHFDPITNNLTRDYALVLMLPNEKKENRILLIYGIYTQGSLAAIEFITNPDRLEEMRKALLALTPARKTPPAYFQMLLETTVENYVPGKVSLVAARIIPDRN